MNTRIVYSNVGAVVQVSETGITASVPFDLSSQGEFSYTAHNEGAVGSVREVVARRKEFIRTARVALLCAGHTVITPAWVDC